MAQIMISEEHYRELLALAQERGTTPDVLADTWIEDQLIAADQEAFWGKERMEEIEQQAEAIRQHGLPPGTTAYHSLDEFFASLHEPQPSVPEANPDADV